MASCSEPCSVVRSRCSHSRAKAISIGGGGPGDRIAVDEATNTRPEDSIAAAIVHDTGERLLHSRRTSRVIHATIATNSAAPPPARIALALSGSRNSFDVTTWTPRKVRNTVGVSGAPVIVA